MNFAKASSTVRQDVLTARLTRLCIFLHSLPVAVLVYFDELETLFSSGVYKHAVRYW